VYRPHLFAILLVWLTQPMLLTAQAKDVSVNNPMRPPAVAIQKYQQAKNLNKPKVAAGQGKWKKTKTLELTSILYSATRKIAIIDDKMLSVGDKIYGAKLVRIKKNSARLISNGKTINLRISSKSTNIRKTVVSQTMAKEK
jgi:hypothetical protein